MKKLMGVLLVCFMALECVLAIEKIKILDTGKQPGHYLEYNGNPILLIGDSVTQGWVESGTNFNQTGYVDALANRGINVLMIWSYIGTDSNTQNSDYRIGYNSPEIWPWQGSPDNNSFNLRQFNQAYFDRLKSLVNYAESKGVIVLICVHDGWTKTRFGGHPFNSTNGNGPLSSNSQYVELSDYNNEMPATYNSGWSRRQKNQYFQERFCGKLISELDSYSNVMYEMFNEGEWYDRTMHNNHEQHFLKFFRDRCTNILLTNTDHIRGDNPHSDSKVDIVSLHGDWDNRFGDFQSGFNQSPAKAYFLSEPVPDWDGDNITLAVVRKCAWNVAMGGSGWVNQNNPSFSWDPNTTITDQISNRNAAYNYAGYCAKFFNESGVNFSDMKPEGNLASTNICLADKGNEYVVYAPSGGSFTLNLSNAGGKTLSVRWYNPRTGQFTNDSDVTGGSSSKSFTPPFNNDAVLHVGVNVGQVDTTPPSIPQNLNAQAISDSQINLSWSPSSDAGSGVSHYKIYRNGVNVKSISSISHTGMSKTQTSYTTAAMGVFLAVGETYTLIPDAHTGREETTQPKTDANDGQNGDSIYYRRHNIARANLPSDFPCFYWYSSAYQDPGEPDPTGEQWVDYKPPLGQLGTGEYRIVVYYWKNSNRPQSYDCKYIINHADGQSIVYQNQYDPGNACGSVTLGEFDLDYNSYVRAEDTGIKAITFGRMEFTLISGGGGGGGDTTPPSIPQNLNTQAISGSQINLTWSASSDPESGVSYYKIYRDGVKIGQSNNTSYSDTGLDKNTSYIYEVSAVNVEGIESGKSGSASSTTFSNNTSYADTGLNANTKYTYKVSAVNVEGIESEKSSPVSATTLGSGTQPTYGNVKVYDNLFDPNQGGKGKISYKLTQAGQVTIKIYTLNGELVRILVDEEKQAGDYLPPNDPGTEWDGKNDEGDLVANGIYVVKIKLPGSVYTRKFALIKE